MKGSGIGGQAVMEGVMMKNGDRYAVAVRKPDKEIIVKTEESPAFIKGKKVLEPPFVRGVFSFCGFTGAWHENTDIPAGFLRMKRRKSRRRSRQSLIKNRQLFKHKEGHGHPDGHYGGYFHGLCCSGIYDPAVFSVAASSEGDGQYQHYCYLRGYSEDCDLPCFISS